jgi:hypothetical protein
LAVNVIHLELPEIRLLDGQFFLPFLNLVVCSPDGVIHLRAHPVLDDPQQFLHLGYLFLKSIHFALYFVLRVLSVLLGCESRHCLSELIELPFACFHCQILIHLPDHLPALSMLVVERIHLLLKLLNGWHYFAVEVLEVIVEAVPLCELCTQLKQLLLVRLGLPSVSDIYLNFFHRLQVILMVFCHRF